MKQAEIKPWTAHIPLDLAQMSYLTVLDHHHAKLVWVRIPRPENRKKVVSYSFSFKKRGGRAKAILAARKWRNWIWAELYGKPYPGDHIPGKSHQKGCAPPYRTRVVEQTHPETGMTGVSEKTESWTNADGTVSTYSYWVAVIRLGPQSKRYTKTRTWSQAKYGKAEALKLAKAWRLDMIEKHYGC